MFYLNQNLPKICQKRGFLKSIIYHSPEKIKIFQKMRKKIFLKKSGNSVKSTYQVENAQKKFNIQE